MYFKMNESGYLRGVKDCDLCLAPADAIVGPGDKKLCGEVTVEGWRRKSHFSNLSLLTFLKWKESVNKSTVEQKFLSDKPQT